MPELVYKRKRRRKRTIKPKLFFAAAGLMMLLGLVEQSAQGPGAARKIRTVPESFSFAGYTVPVVRESLADRKFYPYSVIRGGVRDRAELQQAISRDPVVARHYADFDAAAAHIVRVQDARHVHVSYRIDDKVYWTARKIVLNRGEVLISDGQNQARARCGNRVSVVPQEPTSAEEPPPEVFNIPDIPVSHEMLVVTETITPETIPLVEELRPPLAMDFPDLPPLATSFFAEEFLPRNTKIDIAPPMLYAEPEISEVPEPGTLVLVASILALEILRRQWISRRLRRAAGRIDSPRSTGRPVE